MAVLPFPLPPPADRTYPPVAVIVPIYNGAADLPDLVERLLAQTYPAKQVTYILVDNGSTDATPALLQQAAATAAEAGIALRPLPYSAIQSSYAARNAGIRAALALAPAPPVLAFTDADCYPEPGWLEALVQPFAQPEVGLVAGEIRALPGTTWLEHYADRQDTLSQQHTLGHRFAPYGQTANLAVRVACLPASGLFRPHLTTGGDADLCWRILDSGPWQIGVAPEAVLSHRHRQTLAELRSQWHRYGCSNRYLHELHGIPLTRALTAKEVRYRLLRWVAKELPQGLWGTLRGNPWHDLATTPLDLWCSHARSQGQQHSVLPAAAQTIDPFPTEAAIADPAPTDPPSADSAACS